ncbi:hypothetical protein chiPu_0007445 [Chiloscyllium punctatum]|uniref:Uncharacterized protein n=1 Tax=Chiloscyllium punctatum TaxID=137246 RepID=A0A401SF34_CHIPU|nr:hypothetical protein [Chiloscyllium punctatum]
MWLLKLNGWSKVLRVLQMIDLLTVMLFKVRVSREGFKKSTVPDSTPAQRRQVAAAAAPTGEPPTPPTVGVYWSLLSPPVPTAMSDYTRLNLQRLNIHCSNVTVFPISSRGHCELPRTLWTDQVICIGGRLL